MEPAGKSVLIGCEESGTVREEYRKLGHDAWSCDLQPARDKSPYHIQGDVIQAARSRRWNTFIVHPDCTYLTSSGQHWNGRLPGRQALTEAAVEFFMTCVRVAEEMGIPEFSAENPVGIMSTRWRKPDQIIQPFEFGDDASKSTCLWSRGLPLLEGTDYIFPRWVCGNCRERERERERVHHKTLVHCKQCQARMLPRWGNQTDSGQNKLAPSPTRKRDRSKTYHGIAVAMATQWGNRMNTYHYEHHDGRKGEGYSIYSAITKALGLEATILKIADPIWHDQPDRSRKATIREKSSGKKVGTMIIPYVDLKARKQ